MILQRTLIFAAVAGEEQGLFGSAFRSSKTEGMLDNNIVGSFTADDGTITGKAYQLLTTPAKFLS